MVMSNQRAILLAIGDRVNDVGALSYAHWHCYVEVSIVFLFPLLSTDFVCLGHSAGIANSQFHLAKNSCARGGIRDY